ncbi:putative ribonuclease H-like domain-containing protein [Tanacetum coccineum]
MNKDQNLFIPPNQVVNVCKTINFSLHDDEELSLHDDASLNGSEPTSNKGDAPAKPPQIITTNTLSNIKLPVLQKDDYDTWAMEMEHYLEYIDNEVWKVIQNGNSRSESPKLMAVPKDHLRRFHGKDDAKRDLGKPSRQGKLRERYDRFQKTPITIGSLGAGVSDEMQITILRSFHCRTPRASQASIKHASLRKIVLIPLPFQSKTNCYSCLADEEVYKKTAGRPRVDGNMHVAFDKRKVECFNCHNTGHFARECKFKGSKEGQINWVEQTTDEELNHALMAFTVNNEVSMCSKLCLDSFNALQAKYDELQSEFGDQEAALVAIKKKARELLLRAQGWFMLMLRLATPPGQLKQVLIKQITTLQTCTTKKRLDQPYTASKTIKTGRVNVNTGHGNVSSVGYAGTQFKSGTSSFNTGKQHVNSGSMYVNSGTQNKSGGSKVNTGKQNVNSGRVHVNTARVTRPVLSNQTSQVNFKSPKTCFSKQRSPANRPFTKNTAHKSTNYAVKGKMGTAVKTSAGCVWRKTTPHSNPNGGPTPASYVHVSQGPQGRPKPVKAWHMEHRGIFDSGCSGHMTGNRAHLEDYQELSKVGSVTFGGSKGSISGKANPAGSKEVLDIDVQTEEAADLMVVSSTSLTKATRKAAVSEKIATKKTHSPKQPSSTPISKSADDIMTFRKELDALALKHLGPVPATAPTSTNPVNTGSINLNTAFEEVNSGNIEAISPSADHEEEVFSDADDDEMPEIRIYDKSSEGIFEKASYDDDGIITDFNNLPDEVDVSTNHTLRIHNAHPQSQILGDPNTPVQTRSSLKKITEAHALVSHIQAQQRSNHKDQQHCLFACFLSQSEPRKVSEALEDESWVEAMQEELLQFKLQQVWVLVDLPNGAKVKVQMGIQETRRMRGE